MPVCYPGAKAEPRLRLLNFADLLWSAAIKAERWKNLKKPTSQPNPAGNSAGWLEGGITHWDTGNFHWAPVARLSWGWEDFNDYFVISTTTGRVFQLKVICGGFVWFEAQHQTILGTNAIHDSAKIINHHCNSKVARCKRKRALKIKPRVEIL